MTDLTDKVMMLGAATIFIGVLIAALTVQYQNERDHRREIVRRIRRRGPVVRRPDE
jgi:hypothetical protein